MKAIPLLLLLASAVTASATVTIDYATVGNAGNPADTTGYGAVAYSYNIARNETTISQYAEFLNAAAKSDPYGLYNASMGSDANVAGIVRSGADGSYTYSVTGSGNRPITYVSWFDAARFVNWMSNGQGSGSTETGAYNLNGATFGFFQAQPGASVRLPTEDEWYKAAYYDPTKNGGAGGYWAYATRSDTLTNNTIGAAGGANFFDRDYAITQSASFSSSQSYLTDVGAYGAASASHYGTNDQAGSVWEWNDAVIPTSYRGLRGGGWSNPDYDTSSSERNSAEPWREYDDLGFRVASIPEPGAWVLAVFSGALCATRRKR